jgi:hypothetical protein
VKWLHALGCKLHRITKADVAARVTELRTRNGEATALATRGALNAFFAWAIGEGLCDNNPVIGTNRPDKSKSRNRMLTDQELRNVWNASSSSRRISGTPPNRGNLYRRRVGTEILAAGTTAIFRFWGAGSIFGHVRHSTPKMFAAVVVARIRMPNPFRSSSHTNSSDWRGLSDRVATAACVSFIGGGSLRATIGSKVEAQPWLPLTSSDPNENA